eukprot:323181-Chlamydomonas_euryale.AAC.1
MWGAAHSVQPGGRGVLLIQAGLKAACGQPGWGHSCWAVTFTACWVATCPCSTQARPGQVGAAVVGADSYPVLV